MSCLFLLFSVFFYSCQQDVDVDLYTKWQENQQQAVDWLLRLSAVEQQFQIQQLLEKDSEAALLLCTTSKAEKLDPCHRILQRPHLYEPPEQYARNQKSVAIFQESPSVLHNITARTDVCPSDKKKMQCALDLALQQSELKDVASACNILSIRQRAECYFQVADSYNGKMTSLLKQVQLCQAAQPYGDRCLNHLIDQSIENILQSIPQTERQFQQLVLLQQQLQQLNEPWMNTLQQVFWSYGSFRIIEQQEVCGKEISAVPSEAQHFVIANIIYTHYPQTASIPFSEKLTQTEKLLERKCTKRAQKPVPPPTITDYWALQGHYPSEITQQTEQVVYLRSTSRLRAFDTDLDNALMWLEAAAQHKDWKGVRQAMESGDVVLQWRGAMILDGSKN